MLHVYNLADCSTDFSVVLNIYGFLSWLQEKGCQYGCNQTLYSTPIYIISDKLLMMGRSQHLPCAHPIPQAISWMLDEKSQTLRGGVVFLCLHCDSAYDNSLGESSSTTHPERVTSANGP